MENKNIVAGVAGGKHIVAQPLTTSAAESAAPGLLMSELDRRVVKIRPMSTPLDQISRMAGARQAGSMKVEYYSVDTQPVKLTVTSGYTPNRGDSGPVTVKLGVDNPAVIAKSTTVLVPSVTVPFTSGSRTEQRPLILYAAKCDSELLEFLPVNVADDVTVPEIKEGTVLIRMGRAAGELDMTTPQFSALPRKEYNLCQIFK